MSNIKMPNGEPDTGQYVPYHTHNLKNFQERMQERKKRVKQNPVPVFVGRIE